VAATLATPSVRPTTACAWADAAINAPSNITHHRNPAILSMAFTFPGDGLPDAGFLCVMVARVDRACPRD
jgi:hypothetical protein